MLDTNVVMSGLFFGGQPSRILEACNRGGFDWVASMAVLTEYGRVGLELGRGIRRGARSWTRFSRRWPAGRRWSTHHRYMNQSRPIRMTICCSHWRCPRMRARSSRAITICGRTTVGGGSPCTRRGASSTRSVGARAYNEAVEKPIDDRRGSAQVRFERHIARRIDDRRGSNLSVSRNGTRTTISVRSRTNSTASTSACARRSASSGGAW